MKWVKKRILFRKFNEMEIYGISGLYISFNCLVGYGIVEWVRVEALEMTVKWVYYDFFSSLCEWDYGFSFQFHFVVSFQWLVLCYKWNYYMQRCCLTEMTLLRDLRITYHHLYTTQKLICLFFLILI